jgi:hypothetical protein
MPELVPTRLQRLHAIAPLGGLVAVVGLLLTWYRAGPGTTSGVNGAGTQTAAQARLLAR